MLLFIIIFLTALLVLNCVLLTFLVLMQLPKKEAGAGLAFGGAATDALFGAGSGNFLTKTTKYAAGAFFILAIALSLLEGYRAHQPGSDFNERIQRQAQQQPAITAPPTTAQPTATTQPSTISTNNPIVLPPVETNAPAATGPATSAIPAAPAQPK